MIDLNGELKNEREKKKAQNTKTKTKKSLKTVVEN